MENIFENAKFGDKFLTRDNRIAVFVGTYIDEDNKPWWKFVISGENGIRFYNEYNKTGLLDMSDRDFTNDIIAKYKEPIDEDKLYKKANEELFSSPIYKIKGYHTKQEMWEDGFVTGYRTAKEE